MDSLEDLPGNLPAPTDDGSCNHLLGKQLPDVTLFSTSNNYVNLKILEGLAVIYCYPMTGQPGVELPNGWDQLPGARGCTPQSCSFRDHYAELLELNACVYGMSTQTTDYQKEAKERLHLPYDLLSDENLNFFDCFATPIPLSKYYNAIQKGYIDS